ncbi:MAG: heparinase II/III family protein, partial [Spirochaetia bacterium]|nr:heparinase II/III family protein [Spirochaetia bacterium]
MEKIDLENLMAMPLDQTRTAFNQLFPGPEEGRIVEINPPPFFWLKVAGVEKYVIHLENTSRSFSIRHETSDNYWISPKVLEPGTYRWDLEAGGMRRGWWTFTLSAKASIQIIPDVDSVLKKIPLEHPRHYLRRGDSAAIRKRHARHLPSLRRTIEIALVDGTPPTPDIHLAPDTLTQNLRYREWTNLARKHIDRNLVACTLGHVLLGDAKAAKMARTSLLAVCNWNPEGPCSADGPWGDEIGLSMVRCLPFVIDSLADTLSEKELRFAKKALTAYARQAYGRLRRTDFTYTPGDSHVGRLCGYVGEAAIILHGTLDESECREWLSYSLRVFGGFFPFFGGADGGWAEGTFYATSYTRWYLPFFLALERISGFSFLERPFYRRVADFFLHVARFEWDVHPFGDGWWCRSNDVEWPGFFAQDPFRIYAERFGSPRLHAYRKKNPPPKHLELHLLDLVVPPSLLKPSKQKSTGTQTTDALFPDTGFASLQVDLVNELKNTALLVRASKFGNGSHQHADQGSFNIVHQGKGLVIPSGTFGALYGSAHHNLWTRQTKAHNCVLINGQGQRPGHLGAAHFQKMDEGNAGGRAFSHLVCDLTSAYEDAAHYFRHFYFLKPDLIIVADEIRLKSPGQITWCLHTPSAPKVGPEKSVMKSGKSKLEVALLSGGKSHRSKLIHRYPVAVNEGI